MMEPTIEIGIDLGTYNSACSVSLGDEVILLRSREGNTEQGVCFPSFVQFDEDGELLRVGEYARRDQDVHPSRVVWGVKRMIGKSFRQVKKSGDLKRFPYKVIEGRDGSCRIVVGGREYSPTEISTFVLKKIKEDSEADFNPLNATVTAATITVPAYFSPFQRAETEQAARLAGFEKVHLIPEPTSAALAYKLKVEAENQFILVIDMGAGTLDVTAALMHLDDDGTLQTAERGHGGDTSLGGLDIDDAIVEHIVRREKLKHVVRDSHGKARLRAELERAKIELSTTTDTTVGFAFGGGDVDFRVSRKDIETAVAPVLQRTLGPIEIALKEAGLTEKEISHVLLVGGPTKMPEFRSLIAQRFAANPKVVREIQAIDQDGFPVDPMEAVAHGAVLGMFGGITPHAYGVILESNYFELVPRRTRYPCSNSASWGLSSRKRSMVLQLIQKEVDPKKYNEVYMLLGMFQFDYQPEQDNSHVQIEAEYTENGVLNLQIVQPSSMVTLPLYNVSKLTGKRITKPSTPLQISEPTYHMPPPPGGPGGGPGGTAPPPPPSAEWTHKDLDAAIRSGNALRSLAEARLQDASAADRQSIEELIGQLGEWIGNTWADINKRTPQVRNLNRALLICLQSAKLISPEELRELQRALQ